MCLCIQGWERAKSRGTDRQYCWNNFLSANTLRVSHGAMRTEKATSITGCRWPSSHDRLASINHLYITVSLSWHVLKPAPRACCQQGIIQDVEYEIPVVYFSCDVVWNR